MKNVTLMLQFLMTFLSTVLIYHHSKIPHIKCSSSPPDMILDILHNSVYSVFLQNSVCINVFFIIKTPYFQFLKNQCIRTPLRKILRTVNN